MDDIRLNEQHDDYIYVYDSNGDPVTGLVQGDFTVQVTIDGVPKTKAVSITEVSAASRPGLYDMKFTPDEKGEWWIQVKHAVYQPLGWFGYYRVVSAIAEDLMIEGSGNRIVTIDVSDINTGDPIADVHIDVMNSTGITMVAFSHTDADGRAVFHLFDGTYLVYLSKLGQYSFTLPETLTVQGSLTVAYEGTLFSPSAPPAPDLCVVYGWLLDACGQPKSGVSVSAEVVGDRNFLATMPQIVREAETVTSNGTGYWELALTRSSAYNKSGIKYGFKIGKIPSEKTYLIPDAASVAYKTLVEG